MIIYYNIIMEKKSKAQLEKENKELKEKLRIKGGGCRFC